MGKNHNVVIYFQQGEGILQHCNYNYLYEIRSRAQSTLIHGRAPFANIYGECKTTYQEANVVQKAICM